MITWFKLIGETECGWQYPSERNAVSGKALFHFFEWFFYVKHHLLDEIPKLFFPHPYKVALIYIIMSDQLSNIVEKMVQWTAVFLWWRVLAVYKIS